ncbi:MAG: mandelate racemase [Acidobacteria bacterium]|nr:mandelate racemase [Acidobacteriota bacterium]MDA1234419.1 mandelate racemase [Acidobacteriota bacterium]
MLRRTFLGSLAAPAIALAANEQLKIADVEIWRFRGSYEGIVGANGQRQAQPIDIYPEHRPERYVAREGRPGTIRKTVNYLVIKTDKGLDGIYGPVDNEACVVVERQLKPFIMGMDGLAVETMWDKMYRSNRQSRSSHYMMAISAVDNALWDLRGRYFESPVYRLLGGPTREKATVYGSCLGYSIDPELAGEQAAKFKAQGYMHQKWFLAYGPGDGNRGLELNIALVKSLREAVGPEVDIMFDAFMGWDLNYAMAWCRAVEQYSPRWLEEAFHVDKMESFAQLARETTIPIATGEHFYGRWEVKRFLEAEAISVVQADPEWCGGTSELVKICGIASAYDAHVIPHGHNIHASLHVVASQSPMTCPLVEVLINKMKDYYYFDKYAPVVVNGQLDLSDRPGFGMELDDAKIEARELMDWA